MTAYYLTILLVLGFSYAASKTDRLGRSQKDRYNPITVLFLVLTASVFIFTTGLRYYVGTDYGGYYNGISHFGGRLKESLVKLDEPGLPILATIIGSFTNDGAYFIFACAFITITLLLYPTYRYSDSFVFCTLLFIFTGNWHGCFNGVRQFLAAAIVFAGHRYILDKKFWKSLIIVFLAFCVHRSAIIMIVPYFLFRNRITFRNVILLVIGTYILAQNYDTIFSFIGLLKESEIAVEDQAYYGATVNILRVLVSCAPAIAVVVLYWGKSLNREQTFYFNALLANAASMLATSNSTYLARLNIYTNVFTPLAMAKLLHFENKILDTIFKLVIVILYAVYWYIEVSGSNTLATFRWIWERGI